MTSILRIRNGWVVLFFLYAAPPSITSTGVLSLAPVISSSFLQSDDMYLSDRLSSPQRYASALNLTMGEVARIKQEHENATAKLHRILASDEIPGKEKHELLCQHRLDHGRHPFVCKKCWSYLPVCVCSMAGGDKISLPQNLSVVVWTHHREWGLTSNTGGLVGLVLEDCHVLMKGLAAHEAILTQYLDDPDTVVLVLWPDPKSDNNTGRTGAGARHMALPVAKEILRNKKVVLIAIDGTWRNPRRMVARLPQDKLYCTDLSMNALQAIFDGRGNRATIYGKFGRGSQSLLAPLRGRGPNVGENQVCTAEAVAGALIQLGLPRTEADRLLSLAINKVDLVCRYRAKV